MNTLLDIPLVAPAPERGIVKRLSQRHRNLARLLASGVKPGDAARILRYDPSRVSVLQTDAAFQALVSYYETIKDEEFQRSAEKLADLTETVIDELQERLEGNPDEFSIGQLTKLLETAADRSGLGPTSTQRNVTINVSAETLAEVKRGIAPQLVEVLPSIQAGESLGSDRGLQSDPAETAQPHSTSGPGLSGQSNEKDKEGASS